MRKRGAPLQTHAPSRLIHFAGRRAASDNAVISWWLLFSHLHLFPQQLTCPTTQSATAVCNYPNMPGKCIGIDSYCSLGKLNWFLRSGGYYPTTIKQIHIPLALFCSVPTWQKKALDAIDSLFSSAVWFSRNQMLSKAGLTLFRFFLQRTGCFQMQAYMPRGNNAAVDAAILQKHLKCQGVTVFETGLSTDTII